VTDTNEVQDAELQARDALDRVSALYYEQYQNGDPSAAERYVTYLLERAAAIEAATYGRVDPPPDPQQTEMPPAATEGIPDTGLTDTNALQTSLSSVPRRRRSTAQHGTYGGYRWHLRHKEKPCEPCREAASEYNRKYAATRHAPGYVPRRRDAHTYAPAAPAAPVAVRPVAVQPDDNAHGRLPGYLAHRQRNEELCVLCKEFKARYKFSDTYVPDHGTTSGHTWHTVARVPHCQPCRDAKQFYDRTRKAKARRRAAAADARKQRKQQPVLPAPEPSPNPIIPADSHYSNPRIAAKHREQEHTRQVARQLFEETSPLWSVEHFPEFAQIQEGYPGLVTSLNLSKCELHDDCGRVSYEEES
jgi:hypothetical protein